MPFKPPFENYNLAKGLRYIKLLHSKIFKIISADNRMDRKRMDKKAQIMGMPFQMIFSLILIAVFIYSAFVGIRYFMQTADQAKILTFLADLDSKVEQAWLTTESKQTYSFDLPSKIKYVCFANVNSTVKGKTGIEACSDFEDKYSLNFKDKNLFFCPAEGAWQVGAPIYKMIDCKGRNCLNFSKSPYCIENLNGKISITLEKKLGEGKIQLS